MENLLSITPLQALLILALNAWILIIFPILVIRKLNYLTALLESQFDEDEPEQDSQS